MKAEFTRPDAPDDVVATATWDGAGVRLEAADPDAVAAAGRIFRPIPIVVDDPSLRGAGAAGPSTLEPGGLDWFMEAALSRAGAEGLQARLMATDRRMGWDPAGAYRTFRQTVDRASAPDPPGA